MTQENQLPHGWLLAGSRPECYAVSVEPKGLRDASVVRLRSREGQAPVWFGTVMQTFRADNYRGRRLRYEAAVRSESVAEGAALWMRVDGVERGRSLAFDNMDDRPIRGTGSWKRYAVVLDVPETANAIAFGILLRGAGDVWLGEPRIEAVSREVPETGTRQRVPDHPVNLELSVSA